MTKKNRPLTLLILDGWGYTQETEYNAIAQAKTPVWNTLWVTCPHTFLSASGADVGLPGDQMGNSEVGHLNLGSGRVVYQEFTRITRSIRTGSFFDNKTLTKAVDQAVQQDKAIHILGLLSPGGVHSHEDHIQAMLELAKKRGGQRIYLHAFLDGRDMPPKSAASSIKLMEKKFKELGAGCFASICGRFYAMDRDHRWDRVQQAYDAMVSAKVKYSAPSAKRGLEMAYERQENDEFVKPTLIVPEGGEAVRIEDGDVVFFMNFRSDRARQITRAFTEKDFKEFQTARRPQVLFVSLTEYQKDFDIPVAYPPETLRNVFGEYIAHAGLHQLRIAETEKYAHVTFFFNGGKEAVYEGEERMLVPSPKISTYDLQPEMSAQAVTDKLVEAIHRTHQPFDAIICNYANTDMVGHTGKLDAAVRAVEFVDQCLGRVIAASRAVGGEVLVTADHGNVEKMRDPETGQAHTAHTTNLVPFVYVGNRTVKIKETPGVLADVAPTMLTLMGLEVPPQMSGHSLLTLVG